MESTEFREASHQLIDYVISYMDNIRSRPVLPSVQPGYMRNLLPSEAPENGEPWKNIFNDIERVVMSGVTHWNSPNFFSYCPTGNSWPSVLADILSDVIGCVGFSWMSSPACTELETVMMNWLAKMLKLPDIFLSTESKGVGGGVIQTSASESTLVTLLAARRKAIQALSSGDEDNHNVMSRLVAYTSDQAHSSIAKAAMLGGVKIRHLPSDEHLSLRGETLREAIKEDREKNLVPFFVAASLGTTSSCAFDTLSEIGLVCQDEQLWLHIDAAYAGAAFICPEYRHLLDGVEYATSFCFNPHKWLMVHFDCSALWLKKASDLVDAFNVDPVYLRHDKQGQVPDYRHWQIALGRRFRSLKLWFVIRTYGITGLQENIRRQIKLAKEFEELVRSDGRLEIPVEPKMAVVCFKIKGPNEETEKLLKRLTERKKVFMVPSCIRHLYVIRFVVCSTLTTSDDVKAAWEEVSNVLTSLERSEA